MLMARCIHAQIQLLLARMQITETCNSTKLQAWPTVFQNQANTKFTSQSVYREARISPLLHSRIFLIQITSLVQKLAQLRCRKNIMSWLHSLDGSAQHTWEATGVRSSARSPEAPLPMSDVCLEFLKVQAREASC